MLVNKQPTVFSSRCSSGAVKRSTTRPVIRRGNFVCRAQSQRPNRRDAMQERQQNKNEKLRVLRLISACVESNAITQKFEELAGRSAMVGFAVAVSAELAAPQQGLFGAWDSSDISLYAATAILLVTVSALLATMSKRRLGLKFKEAVITSLTAFSRSRGSLTNQTVDSAVDYVFEEVFDRDMVLRNLIQDEFL